MSELWSVLAEPFAYEFMVKAMVLASLVGGVCGLLSAYLILKGWSLIGDALSHAVVPGVAMAYVLGLPYTVGAFFSGILAAWAILWIKSFTHLKEDAVIGFVFSSFFALGLFIVSINPMSFNIQDIIFGNILGTTDGDMIQVGVVMVASLAFLLIFYKDLLLVFFDEVHAKSVGISPKVYQVIFFSLLSACVVSAMQTVGAILVIAMVITPGATAYQLTDKFRPMLLLAGIFGVITSGLGVYLSYHLDGATGGVIVSLQTALFMLAFLFSPKFGVITERLKSKNYLKSHTIKKNHV